MTEISENIEIKAPLEKVFKYTVNYRNVPKFIASVTSYDPTTEALWGVGTRFAMGVSVKDFRFTQELEVIELQLGRSLHVRSLSGQHRYAPADNSAHPRRLRAQGVLPDGPEQLLPAGYSRQPR